MVQTLQMSLLLSFWKWGMGWQRLPELEKQLYELSTGDLVAIENTLNEFSSRAATPGEKSILHRTDAINKIFSKDSVEDILAALEAEFEESGEDWAKDLIKIFKRSSPMGLKVTLVSIREARNKTLQECLRTEYRLTINALCGTISKDLYEGIRAIVVEKDNTPKWNPPSLQEVTPEDVKRVFQPFKESLELQLPLKNPRWSGKFLQSWNCEGQTVH
jgi:3-hydroxyisobutyryl-CoA hydrolase